MDFLIFTKRYLTENFILVCSGLNNIILIFFQYNYYFMISSNLQHECQTRATRVRQERHECNNSNTSATRVRQKKKKKHECYTNDKSATRVKNFDFDNDVGKNIFLQSYIWQVKDYKERNNFILRTTFWKCLVSMSKCV